MGNENQGRFLGYSNERNPYDEEADFCLRLFLRGRDQIMWDISELWMYDPPNYWVEETETLMTDLAHLISEELGVQ